MSVLEINHAVDTVTINFIRATPLNPDSLLHLWFLLAEHFKEEKLPHVRRHNQKMLVPFRSTFIFSYQLPSTTFPVSHLAHGENLPTPDFKFADDNFAPFWSFLAAVISAVYLCQ